MQSWQPVCYSCLAPVWLTVGASLGQNLLGVGVQVTSVPACLCRASSCRRRHVLFPGGRVCSALPLLGARSLALLGGCGCSALRRLVAWVPPPPRCAGPGLASTGALSERL